MLPKNYIDELDEDTLLKEDQKIIIQNSGTIIIQNIDKGGVNDPSLDDDDDAYSDSDTDPVTTATIDASNEVKNPVTVSPDDNPYEDEAEPTIPKDKTTSTPITSDEEEPVYNDEIATPEVSDIVPDDLERPEEQPYEDEVTPEEQPTSQPGANTDVPEEAYEDDPQPPTAETKLNNTPQVTPEVTPQVTPEVETPGKNSIPNQPYFEDETSPSAPPLGINSPLPPKKKDNNKNAIPGSTQAGIDAFGGAMAGDPNDIAAQQLAAQQAEGLPIGTPTTITPPVKSNDLRRLYDLKSIHEKLSDVKKILGSESHPIFDKIKDKVTDSSDYFKSVIKNLDGYTDSIDDIITKYKNFLFLVVTETDKYKKIFDKESQEKAKSNIAKEKKKEENDKDMNSSSNGANDEKKDKKSDYYEDEEPNKKKGKK